MNRSLKQIADFVHARVIGDDGVEVKGIASVASAKPGDLVFIENEKNLAAAMGSEASGVIAGRFAETLGGSKPMLVCDQPRLAFVRAAGLFVPDEAKSGIVHPTAVVHESAKLGRNVRVEARAVLGKGVEIGDGSRIGAGSVIAEGVRIGKNCELYPNVTVYSGTCMGEGVIIHAGAVLGSDGFGYVRDAKSGRYEKFPQIGRLEIGDDVEIGANSTVDRGALDVTRIGRGT